MFIKNGDDDKAKILRLIVADEELDEDAKKIAEKYSQAQKMETNTSVKESQ